jgi:hypothetical protein
MSMLFKYTYSFHPGYQPEQMGHTNTIVIMYRIVDLYIKGEICLGFSSHVKAFYLIINEVSIIIQWF